MSAGIGPVVQCYQGGQWCCHCPGLSFMVARFKGERGKRKVGRTCTPNPKAFLGFPIADFHLHPIGQNRVREEDGERLDKPVNSVYTIVLGCLIVDSCLASSVESWDLNIKELFQAHLQGYTLGQSN